MQGPRENLVALALSGALLVGVVLDAPQKPAPQPIAAAPTPSVEVPAAAAAPDLVSWRGPSISPALRLLLDDGRVGGVLLFASNFSGPAGLKALSESLKTLASSACLDHPILVMLDQEGGQVNRMQADFAGPSELVAGAGGVDHVRTVEQTAAAGLRGLGVGLDLAPVADVRTNPRDQTSWIGHSAPAPRLSRLS
jgi:Glycosyl hydrolase family 3 N terminal domain